MAKKVKKTSASKRGVSQKKKIRGSKTRSSKKAKKSKRASASSKRKSTAKKVVTKKKSAAKVKRKASAKKAAKKATKKAASKKKTKKAAPSSRKTSAKKARVKTSSTRKKSAAVSKKASTAGRAKKTPTRPKLAIRVGVDIPKKTPASQRLANHRTSAAASTEDPIQFVEQRKVPKTSLRAKELREFKKLLLQKRDELTGDVNHMAGSAAQAAGAGGAEHSSAPVHMADLGTDNWEHEFTLGLIVNEQKRIHEIDNALKRIENKTYGVCLATHKMISLARLQAKPWAKHCIDYARARDEGRA